MFHNDYNYMLLADIVVSMDTKFSSVSPQKLTLSGRKWFMDGE